MRILHTMIRVGDLQRAIDFYTRVMGMKLLRTSENTEYKYSLAFVGYGDETSSSVIELTYNIIMAMLLAILPLVWMMLLKCVMMSNKRVVKLLVKQDPLKVVKLSSLLLKIQMVIKLS